MLNATSKDVAASIAARTVALSASKTYDGTTSLAGAVSIATDITNEALSYSSATANDKNVATVGKYISVISLADGSGGLASDYRLPDLNNANAPVTISKASLTLTPVTGSKTYDGTTASGAVVGVSGKAASDNVNVAEQYASKDVLGTGNSVLLIKPGYTIVDGSNADMSGNYAVTDTATAIGTIAKAPLSITANNASKSYDGAIYSGGNGVVYSGFVSDESSAVLAGALSYDGTSQGARNAGSYVITPQGLSSANYAVSFVDGTLTISPAALSAIVASLTGASSKVYDGTTSATLTPGNFSLSGFVSGEGAWVTKTSGTFDTASAGVNKTVTVNLAGSDYSATGSTVLSNYTLPTSVSGAIGSITKAPLSVTANNVSKIYDGALYSGGNGVVYSGFVNNESSAVLAGALSYDGTSQGARNAGSYVITPQGLSSANYAVSFVDGTLTISPAALSAIVASLTGASSKVYDGTTSATLTPGNFSLSGFVSGEGAWVTKTSGTFDTASAGTGKTVTVNLAGSDYAANSGTTLSNYTLPTSVSGAIGSITKAPLSVTASNAGKSYDGAVYAGGNGVGYSGFVNNESSAVLSGTLAYAGTSQGAKNAGSYVITPQGLSSANYALSFVDGVLRIDKVPLMVSANDASITYSGVAYRGGNGVVYSGFIKGESDAVLGGALGYGGSSQGAASTGSYVITPNGVTSGNYSLSFVDGTLTVLAAPPPAPTPTPTVAPLPVPSAQVTAKPGATADAPTVGGAASDGLIITVVAQPTIVKTGFVTVSLPKGTATEGVGFRVPLPPEVVSMATTTGSLTTAPAAAPKIELHAIVGGRAVPLPNWIIYLPEQQEFVATAVPDGALPITIEINLAGQRTLMVISERPN